MTIFPEPASRPWLSMRAMLVLVPGLAEGYQLRISRTRAVNSMSASRDRRAARLPAARRKVQGTPCPPCREAGGRADGAVKAGVWAGAAPQTAVGRGEPHGGCRCARRPQ